MKLNRGNTLAWFWGLAEATVFFIVPDVLISWLATESYQRAFVASLWVLCGALLGGSLLWILGQSNPDSLRALLVSLPAIDDAMISKVRSQLDASGLVALFLGPLSGTPYKIYAVEAANLGYGLAIFLLISIPARLSRFLLVSVIAGTLGQLVRRKLSLRAAQVLHVVFWIAFYIWYFGVMADPN
jgi:hypothetical protein